MLSLVHRRLFEWEDREYSTTVLCSWLVFWYYFHPWMTPLLIAALFPVVWFLDAKQRKFICFYLSFHAGLPQLKAQYLFGTIFCVSTDLV